MEDDEEGGGGSAGREKRMGGNSVIRKDIPGLQSRNAHTSPVLGKTSPSLSFVNSHPSIPFGAYDVSGVDMASYHHHYYYYYGTVGNLGRLAGGGWTMGRIKGRDYERESAAFASETKRNQMHVEPVGTTALVTNYLLLDDLMIFIFCFLIFVSSSYLFIYSFPS